MSAMELPLLVGTKKMCMYHEPAGFWPNIFLNIFSGAFKSHYLVSRRGQPGTTNAVKVNWRSFKFTATFTKHFDPQNAPFWRKSLSKSVKIACFWGSGWLKSTPN